jgi:hypothetical protein
VVTPSKLVSLIGGRRNSPNHHDAGRVVLTLGETNIMSARRIEVPENVLAAIRAVVEYWRSTDPDDEDIISNDLPVIYAWLEELGLLSPTD